MNKNIKNTLRKNKRHLLKLFKAGATVLLLFLMWFLCSHFMEYQKNAINQVNKYRIDQACLLGEGMEARQEFVAKHTHLKTVKLYFSNDYTGLAEGDFILRIVHTEDDKTVKEITMEVKELQNNDYTEFLTDIQLKKGDHYALVLTTQNTESGKEPIVYQWSTKEKGLSGKLSIDEEVQKKYLVCQFYYPVTIYQQWAQICLILGIIIFLIWFRISIPKKVRLVLGYLLFYLTPLFTFWFVERFTDNSVFRLRPQELLLNILVYYIFFGICYLVFVSRRAAAGIGMVFWYVIGIVNYFVLNFKGAPIVPSDIMSAGTAANVAGNYTYSVQPVFVWNGLFLLLYFALMYRFPVRKKTGWKKRVIMFFFLAASMGILGSLVVEQNALKSIGVKNNVWDQKKGYAKNGLFFGFVLNLNSLVQEKPSDYSKEAAGDIAHKYEEKYSNEEKKEKGALETKNGEKPNMIFIMNEAFADLSVINDFETSEDYMPFIHSLEKNTIKGSLYMSIFGSGTCNSEFEFLTGNSMSFLQNGIIAYTQIVKDKLPNVTYQLKDQGYQGNLALHPYLASGWNRPQVYEWMGFEDFITEEDFDNPKMYRKYISDQSDMEKITELYEKRENENQPFYLFNVTMQNHGGFDKVYSNFDHNIKITDNHYNEQAQQYLSLVKKTDDAFKELVEYFKKVEEPTIIVMFGDHQPAIASSFYDSLYGASSGDLTPEDLMKKYQTPFIVWANYDIKEGEIDKMSANYLSAYVMEEAGLKTSAYQKFLLELYDDLPVISAMGAYDKDGNFYESPLESPYEDKVKEYQILQYNNLIDTDNTVESFFYLD